MLPPSCLRPHGTGDGRAAAVRAAGAGTPAGERRRRILRLSWTLLCQAQGAPEVPDRSASFRLGAVRELLGSVCASACLEVPCGPAAALVSAAIGSGKAGAGMYLLTFKRWNRRCRGEEMSGIKEPSAWQRETWRDFVVGSQRPGPSGDVGSVP